MARGEVIGRGRDAEIVDYGPGLVIRRPFRSGNSTSGSARPASEAAVMRWVADRGFPAPRVFDETPGGLVMERIDGATMRDVLSARTLRTHMRTLAELHALLHSIPVPPDLPRPFDIAGSLVHGDLHPGNVILAARGPVVIDWTTACEAPPGADIATAWLLMACADLPPRGAARIRQRAARGLATRALVRAAERTSEATLARTQLAAVVAHRKAWDPNLTPTELALMTRLARRRGRR